MRKYAAGLSVALLATVALAGSGATQEPKAAKLAFVGRAKPVLRLVDGERRAKVTLLVANTGMADSGDVTFALLEDGRSSLDACGVEELTSGPTLTAKPCEITPRPVRLAIGASGRFTLTFEVPHDGPLRDPLVEARSAVPGVPSAFAELSVARSLSDRRLWWPVWAAVIAALAFLASGIYATRDAAHRDTVTAAPKGLARVWRWATTKIFTAAAWTFTGSWATSIAALGGVLGTVLAATGFFTEVFPGVSAGRFTGFSVVFGALAVLAPITYTALGRRDEDLSVTVGTVAGLLVAGAVTVAAVAGQLTALGLLVRMSDASSTFQALCFVGLVIGGALVIAHATRSAGWLSRQDPPGPEAKEVAAGTAAAALVSRAAATSSGVP